MENLTIGLLSRPSILATPVSAQYPALVCRNAPRAHGTALSTKEFIGATEGALNGDD